MRTLDTAGAALLARLIAGEQIPVTQLVQLTLTAGTFYLTSAGHDITWNGQTWSAGALGPITPVEDTDSDLAPLQFTMPGLTPQQKAVALEPGVEGASVKVYDCLVDPQTGAASALLAWSGTLNVPGLTDGSSAVLTVTAEHRGTTALRVKPSRYTNDEQQRLFTGDSSLNVDPLTDAAPLVWPAASFWKQ
jgi:hypothetical protein